MSWQGYQGRIPRKDIKVGYRKRMKSKDIKDGNQGRVSRNVLRRMGKYEEGCHGRDSKKQDIEKGWTDMKKDVMAGISRKDTKKRYQSRISKKDEKQGYQGWKSGKFLGRC
jgi:hypothetical protein